LIELQISAMPAAAMVQSVLLVLGDLGKIVLKRELPCSVSVPMV
jgi:hypothetical protein